jgi:hypothetical protein
MEMRMDEWVLRLAEELTQIIPVGQPFVKNHATGTRAKQCYNRQQI